jgi:nucleotide-binding universal stress UspA family protein
MIKRILVALSGTPYTASAIQHALQLARTHDASVTGVTAFDTERLSDVGPIPIGGGSAAHHLAEHRITLTAERIEEVIVEFEQKAKDAGVDVSVHRETGDALDELASLWRYHDLTVFGLRGLFEYGVVHNPDDLIIKMMTRGVRPIITVAEQHRTIGRVLIAYNGSMESAKAMKRYMQMQLWPGAHVKVACFGFDDDKAGPLLADAEAYCAAHGVKIETESVEGYPQEGLLKHAHHWNADLVVMGATARSKLAKWMLGETALDAMRHSNVPLYLSQ